MPIRYLDPDTLSLHSDTLNPFQYECHKIDLVVPMEGQIRRPMAFERVKLIVIIHSLASISSMDQYLWKF